MRNYFASVVIHNLLPGDYKDPKIEKIEKAVNVALSSLAQRMKADDENMIFSFPQDPSVRTSSVPVLVEITLLSGEAEISPGISSDEIAGRVRTNLLKCFRGREEVVVVAQWPGNLIGYAPRE